MSRKKIAAAIAAVATPAALSLALAVAPASASPCVPRAHVASAPACMTPNVLADEAGPLVHYHA
jgi:hypothetical protein